MITRTISIIDDNFADGVHDKYIDVHPLNSPIFGMRTIITTFFPEINSNAPRLGKFRQVELIEGVPNLEISIKVPSYT